MQSIRNYLVHGMWLITGIAFSLSFYAIFLRWVDFSGWSLWLILLLFAGLGTWLAQNLTMRVLLPASQKVSPRQKMMVFIIAVGFSLWLMIAIPLRPEWMAFVYPKHELIISPVLQNEGSNPSARVWVEHLSDGNRYRIPLHQFQGEGWQRSDEGWILPTGQGGSLRWRGHLLNRGYLVFRGGPEGGKAQVQWDGKPYEVNLSAPEVSQIIVKLDVSHPYAKPLSWLGLLSYGWMLVWVFLSLTGYAVLNPREASLVPVSWKAWIRYSIPPLFTGLLYWLTFYPAILSEDSIDQWRQVLTGQFNDWAPAIYTIITAGVAKIWHTPASMALLQVLVFSLLVGWGVGQFRSLGLPQGIGWGLSLLFALVPANPLLAITHWKDVLYSYGLAGLFILCVWIAETQGKWLAERRHWFGLSFMATTVFLFRHNGAAIFFVVFLVLLVLYQRYWKSIGLATLVGLAIGFGIRGPLYDFFRVDRNSYILGDTIFLHHFGAHITGGTPLIEEERAYFNALTPLEEWPYYCCNVSPIYFTDRFNHQLFADNHSRHLGMFFQLALRNPGVELKHWLCSSGLVWRVCVECTTLYHNIEIVNGDVRWIEKNPYGVSEQSRLPWLTLPLAEWVVWSSTYGAGVLWSAGGALHVFLVIWGIVSLQRRSWTWGVAVGVVPILQSLIMALVNISSDFRYQYGVFLIALFSLGMLWMGKTARSSG